MNFRIPLPKLSPLQARLAASFFATLLLVIVWMVWTLPSTAYSSNTNNIAQHDNNKSGGPTVRKGAHDVFFTYADGKEVPKDELWANDGQQYDPMGINSQQGLSGGFNGLPQLHSASSKTDKQKQMTLGKRQFPNVNELILEKPAQLNLRIGEVQSWGLSNQQIFGGTSTSSQSSTSTASAIDDDNDANPRNKTIFITFNTCIQPQPEGRTTFPPPQLEIYFSNSTVNTNPGPDVEDAPQQIFLADEGFANFTIPASGDIFVSVVAPNATGTMANGNWSGFYNYELVASLEQPYHGVSGHSNLFLIDSDNTEALLITGNMTDLPENVNLTDVTPPYTIFANPRNRTNVDGLKKSFCGMKASAMLGVSEDVDVSMTMRGLGHLPKQQFFLKKLNSSTTYDIWLAKANNNTSGGVVFQAANLTTKLDGNCRVIYDLDFCSEVAFAVPSNETTFQDAKRLGDFYDSIASNWYKNFTYSLDQIQCNTSQERTYSLMRNCDNCAEAYKTWLCAVTIPRCADFSSQQTFLATRGALPGSLNSGPTKQFLDNGTIVDLEGVDATEGDDKNKGQSKIKSASRNVLIDQVVSPGPYKEIKPCVDLCYNLVQSCPAKLGFKCPEGSQQDDSYGQRSPFGDITCSWLGAAYYLSAASSNSFQSLWKIMSLVAFVVIVGLAV